MARSVPAMTKRPLAELDIGDRGFQHMGGDRLALFDHLGCRLDGGGACRLRRARAAGAAAGEQAVAVAFDQADAVERNAERLAQHLRERCGMTLAVVESADQLRHRAVGLEMDAAVFLALRRGHFEETADADAAQAPALAALAPALGKALVVGELQRLLEHGGKIAAVIGRAGGGFVGQVARPDLVAPAQFDAVDADLGGGDVDHPFHVIVALRPPGAAIGIEEGGVGEHDAGRDLDQRRAVEAGDIAHGVERRRLRRHRTHIAAEIAEAGEPQGQEMALGIERQLDRLHVIAAVIVGEEAGRALVGPFHRPPEHRARHAGCTDIRDRAKPSSRTSRRHSG